MNSHTHPTSGSAGQWLRQPAVHAALILFAAVIPYLNTFHVPFLFDDVHTIVQNAAIRDLSYLWPPAGSRWFGYLTFALNYQVGGFAPEGYHAVNLVIHVLNGLLVYWIVTRILFLSLPPDAGHGSAQNEAHSRFVSLFAALLFVSHPVQTQAVTYIVQRFASLATLWYLVSWGLYIKARQAVCEKQGMGNKRQESGDRSQETGIEGQESGVRRQGTGIEGQESGVRSQETGEDQNTKTGSTIKILDRTVLISYLGSLAAAILAMKTKEISFTLPIIIVLTEFSFFKKPGIGRWRRVLFLLPFVMTLFIIPLGLIGTGATVSDTIAGAPASFQATTDISRSDYLLTQFRVIVTYLRLLVLPVNQSLDYDYPVYRSLVAPPVLLSFLFLAAIIGLAGYGYSRSKNDPMLRLISFGVLWFFITLSVESSIVPIADVIFEHRLYLPSIGAFMTIAGACSLIAERVSSSWPRMRPLVPVVALTMIAALMTAAYLRNNVWRSEVDLWEDVISKNPRHARAQAIIGQKFIARGGVDEAISRFKRAIELKPDYAEAYISLGNAYMTKGRLDDGFRAYQAALKIGGLDTYSSAQLTMNVGTYYLRTGKPDKAVEYYRFAADMMPMDAMIHHNLGLAYEAKGLKTEAAEEARKAHDLSPERY